MFDRLIEQLKANPKSIVFTEGNDPRILEASSRLNTGNFLTPILIGNVEEVQAVAKENGFNIEGIKIIDPNNYADLDKMADKMVELRKGKMTKEECVATLKRGNYFGTMLVQMGIADSLLGGATYSTADTVRPALQLIKTKPGNKIVSSCFILTRPAAFGGSDMIAMGDCAINIDPNEDELVEIGSEVAKCAEAFGIEPRIAYLSYSTMGSGKGPTVDMMRNAAKRLKEQEPERKVSDGRAAVRCSCLPGGCQDQAHHRRCGRQRQHLHLPEHQRRQHRL